MVCLAVLRAPLAAEAAKAAEAIWKEQIQAAEASGGPKPDKPQPFTPQEAKKDPTIGTVEILYDFETSEPEEHESDAEWEENETEEVHEPAIVAPRYCFVRVSLRGVRYLIELYQPSSGKVYRLETYHLIYLF